MLNKKLKLGSIFASITFTILVISACEDLGPSEPKKELAIAPILNSISGNPSFSMIPEPRYAHIPYTVTNEYDNGHRTIVPYSDWLLFISRASAPVFSGFEEKNYKHGDIIESTFYKKTLRTVVDRGSTKIKFDGDFNDGGYYHLTINEDFTYDYEQYTITDYVIVEPSCLAYPEGDPLRNAYYQGMSRLVIYSHVTGTISGTTSIGTGTSCIFEFMPGTTTIGTIRGEDDFDLSGSNFWHPANTFVYNFQIKSTAEFFGMRNSVPGQLRYEYNDMNSVLGISFTYSDPFPDIVYSNTALFDLLKSVDTLGTESYGYQNISPEMDYLVYQLNGVWQDSIYLQAAPADADSIAQRMQDIETIWSTY